MAVDLLVLRTTRGDVTLVEVSPGGIALREAAAAVVQRRGHYPHAMAQRTAPLRPRAPAGPGLPRRLRAAPHAGGRRVSLVL